MIRYCVLASGSRGNAIYLEVEDTAVLVDAGLSGKELERRMALAGLSPDKLKALLVTHEHRDHIQGIGIMARRYNIPVYLNGGTLERSSHVVGRIEEILFRTGEEFILGPLTIHPFSISHDAEDPVGFIFSYKGVRLGLATDLGVVTNLVRHTLTGCDALILESNHDPEMLINGPYPWELKRRVQGRLGHLSNMDAAELLNDLSHQGLKQVVLAHLSETNNTSELALKESKALAKKGTVKYDLIAASQDKPTNVFGL